MGEAREVLDRLTGAIFSRNWEAVAGLYATDAVAVTPDQGEIRGNQDIAEWSREFLDAFPDARYESVSEHESGNTAIDEGYMTGTNTEPLISPAGESMPATGKSVRLRACDIATVEDGLITSHRFYFDQMDFLGQLGLTEE
jgi:ketosteroid isomerase-like protein